MYFFLSFVWNILHFLQKNEVKMSEPNDSISSGFEPDTPTLLFGQRIHTGDSQEDLTFDNDSGQFGVSDRTISNQDEIPLIEPHQSSNPE